MERLGGVAQDFRRGDHGYVYREGGIGRPVEVSAEERDGFVRTSLWMLGLHLGAFVLGMIPAWLAVKRVFPRPDDIIGSVVLALVACVLAGVVYWSYARTMRWPARALAGRPVSTRAGPAEPRDQPSYGLIATGAVIMLAWSAFQLQRSVRLGVVMAVATLVIAPLLALRTWRFNRRLTPAQRDRVAAVYKAEREAALKKRDIKGALLMLGFLVFEVALFGAVLLFTIMLTLNLGGSSTDDPDGGLFALGFVLGLGAGLLAVWPVDILCKRLTGASVLEGVGDFASW